MIEVFKTNMHEIPTAEKLVSLLRVHFPGSQINFDLHDCDKILRVEGEDLMIYTIISIVQDYGFSCAILD